MNKVHGIFSQFVYHIFHNVDEFKNATLYVAGVWMMYCHFERYVRHREEIIFIVKFGKTSDAKILPLLRDIPRC